MKFAFRGRLALTALSAVFSLPCFAQVDANSSRSIADIEFSPGGTYGSALGLGLYKFDSSGLGLGLYGNFMASISGKKSPQYDALSVTSFGDPVTDRYKDNLLLFNVGVTKSFSSNFGAYLGVGYGSADGKAQKFDPLRILASNGTYYVNDPANNKSGVNLNGGIIVNLDKVSLNVGYNSFTSRPFAGIGFRF